MPLVARKRRSDVRQRLVSSSVLLSLLILLVACHTPGAIRPVIKVGLVAPFEGRYRYLGYDVFPAVRLALREINQAGGVAGTLVELVAYDDGGAPQMADEQARKLVVDADVVAVIGHFREDTTTAASSTYTSAGLPLVVPGALRPPLETVGELAFWTGLPVSALAEALLREVDEAALVETGQPLGRALRDVAEEQALALYPLVSAQDADWLEVIVAADPPAVLCDAGPVQAGEMIAALRDAGWEGSFLGGPRWAAEDFAAVGAESATGARFVTPWPFVQDLNDGLAFAAAYATVSAGTPPGPSALPAYEAAQLVLEALEMDISAHGEPSRQGVNAALARLTVGSGDVLLYWYRVGSDGLPELQRTIPSPR